ncbi:hypothetical protein CF319_g7866 [Tilletia indica]|nr:hypothetical protein CF319_g7866 [Tilletia indica]KAE8229614.1 hypothetical protein CF326_g5415 [Tilletia indica]
MSGDGGRLGPPPDLRPHGLYDREVPHTSPPVLSEQNANQAPPPSASPKGAPDVAGRCLVIEDRPQLHTARALPVDESRKPLEKPTRRLGTVVKLPPSAEVGTGQAHRRHVPLTTHIHINDVRYPALSSLLDTGSSLSSIDAGLLQRLGGQPSGAPMRVSGLGETETLGFVPITFFIRAKDSHGFQLFLECTMDFHVLPHFAPGLCLGQDFITGFGVVIDALESTAHIRRYSFDVTQHMPRPHAQEAQLCSTTPVTLPARSAAWVPVDTGALSAAVDYTIHPRLMTDVSESVLISGPTALGSKSTAQILLTNHSHRAVQLPRRTPVADAVAAQVGDVSSPSADHRFELGSPLPVGETRGRDDAPTAWRPDPDPLDPEDDPAAPLDAFEVAEDRVSDLTKDAETTLVDGHFRVGVDADGNPHRPVVDLLRRHTAAFALDGRPGLIRDAEMTIPLQPEASLRPEAPRRASPEKRAAMDAAIEQLLDWNVIEPSSSPVSFPVLMVRQYGKWRFCVDYRQLNSATVSDRYPLPTTDAVFQTLQGKRWFSSMDAIRGYHQHPVAAEDRWKTAFICHRGLFQYRTVPFGLKNAPAVFQRLMDRVLGDLRWRTAVIYIDDVVAATATLAEHLETLDAILSRATSIGLKFSPAKCTFAVPNLTLLGRKVSGAGVAVWPGRAQAVQELKRPSTLRDVYHVMGLFGYYREFVDHFAELAEPLTRLTKGWKFESDGNRSRLVRKDGSPSSATDEVVSWGDEQERSFTTLQRLIASPPVLAHPDPTRPYILYVDASKVAFAAVLHQIFVDEDMTDGPSAYPSVGAPLTSGPIPRDRWIAWLRADRYFGPIWRRLTDSVVDDEWSLEDGILVRRVDGRWALPEAAIPAVLRTVHDHNGHFGYTKTFLSLSRSFWRPRLTDVVRAWIAHCLICRKTKVNRRVGELEVGRDAHSPFDAISVDLVLGLSPSHGNDAVLAVLCLFSRMILLEPCKSTITAAGIASILSNRVLRMGWRPRRIVSDSEARVTGQVLQSLATSLGATLTPSPPHHQQANAVERAIQTVQGALRAMTLDGRAPWDRSAVPAVELAINSTPSVATGCRPFDLVFVDHPDIAHAVFDAGARGAGESFDDCLAAAADRLDEARPGDTVYVRLGDRPIPGLGSGKLDPKKAGPFAIREVLSPHRVRLSLPADLRIGDEFAVDQLDVCPGSPDPFAPVRNSPLLRPVDDEDLEAAGVADAGTDDDVAVDDDLAEDGVERLPPRARRPPPMLREFQLGTLRASDAAGEEEFFDGPLTGTRKMEIDGRSVTLRERPIAYQSRLTSVAEKKLVAPELELCCLAWAFARMAHLLEGARVTVVTDHAPMGAMLNSATGIHYGPTITRCRALLLPHLHNLRFVHRPGRLHSNADALSRLVG